MLCQTFRTCAYNTLCIKSTELRFTANHHKVIQHLLDDTTAALNMQQFLQVRLGCHQLPTAVGCRMGSTSACRLFTFVMLELQVMNSTWCLIAWHWLSYAPSMLLCSLVMCTPCTLILGGRTIWGPVIHCLKIVDTYSLPL